MGHIMMGTDVPNWCEQSFEYECRRPKWWLNCVTDDMARNEMTTEMKIDIEKNGRRLSKLMN